MAERPEGRAGDTCDGCLKTIRWKTVELGDLSSTFTPTERRLSCGCMNPPWSQPR